VQRFQTLVLGIGDRQLSLQNLVLALQSDYHFVLEFYVLRLVLFHVVPGFLRNVLLDFS
jgi:hypothetical protein